MSSFPVPVSPPIKTVMLVGATASTRERMPRRAPRRPTMVSTKGISSQPSLRVGKSFLRNATAFMGICPALLLIWITELRAELIDRSFDCEHHKTNTTRSLFFFWALARFSSAPFSADQLPDVEATVLQLDRIGFPLHQRLDGVGIY